MWYGGGHPCSHSALVAANSTERTSRLAVKASHKINRNITTATSDTSEPIDEIMFHSA